MDAHVCSCLPRQASAEIKRAALEATDCRRLEYEVLLGMRDGPTEGHLHGAACAPGFVREEEA